MLAQTSAAEAVFRPLCVRAVAPAITRQLHTVEAGVRSLNEMCMGLLVGKVHLGSPLPLITPPLSHTHTHLSSVDGTTGLLEAPVPRSSFSAHPKNKIKTILEFFLVISSCLKAVTP